MKVVADTNVLISGLLWNGNESDILKFIKLGELTNFISPEIIIELENVLSRKKFQLTEKETNSAMGELLSMSKIIMPKEKINAVKDDPDDNIILECAMEGKADCIISGDGHLLDMVEYKEIPIMPAIDLLKIIRKIG